MPFADDLLEQAQHLAQREPKRPKQASLRRAISTAYYALFHLLITETTMNWKRPTERNALGRMFEHGAMKRASEKKRSKLNAYFKTNPADGADVDLAKCLYEVADTFVQMQQDRHIADYDNARKWSRTETAAKISSVQSAFQNWNQIRLSSPAQDYLVSLLLRER